MHRFNTLLRVSISRKPLNCIGCWTISIFEMRSYMCKLPQRVNYFKTSDYYDNPHAVIYLWPTNYYPYQENISSTFSINSESSISEIEQNFQKNVSSRFDMIVQIFNHIMVTKGLTIHAELLLPSLFGNIVILTVLKILLRLNRAIAYVAMLIAWDRLFSRSTHRHRSVWRHIDWLLRLIET